MARDKVRASEVLREGAEDADRVSAATVGAQQTDATTAVREAREEIGVHINQTDLRFVHLIHYRNHLGDARMGVFFEAEKWRGEPYNAEPHKCSRITWWPLHQLPEGTYPYTAEGIAAYMRGDRFSNVGWPGRCTRP